MPIASGNSRLLAVFWYDGENFIGAEEPLDGMHVIQYGDYLQLDLMHFDIWRDYNQIDIGMEYDELPRGRILFKIPIHQFIVYASRAIVDNDEVRTKLLHYYGLPQTTIFEHDLHYG